MTDRILGLYIIGGRRAWCAEAKSGTIQVDYEDGSFSACGRETFKKWGAVPATEQFDK